MFDKKYRISLADKTDWEKGLAKLPPSGDVWYTDGAKGEDTAGAGVYRRRNGKGCTYPLGSYITVAQTELMAIAHCINWAQEVRNSKHLYICTDSRSAVQALNTYTTNSRLVYDCYIALNRLAEKGPTTLLWLPGHSDIRGNEVADRLAKQAKKESLIGPEPATGISQSLTNSIIRGWVESKHKEAMKAPECNTTRLFIDMKDVDNWRKRILRMGRNGAKTMVGIITDHGMLRKHRHKMGLDNDPTCRFCGKERETTRHILHQCPELEDCRRRYLGTCSPKEGGWKAEAATSILNYWDAILGN